MESGLTTSDSISGGRRLGISLAVASALTLAGIAAGHAQSQTQSPPAVKQFGPRVNQLQGGQVPGANAPKQKIVAEHGDWRIACEESKDGSAGKTACGMMQTAKHPKRKNVGLTLVLVKGQQQDKQVTMMRVMAPIGVFLPTGLALEIDGAAVGRVPFTRCLPQVCVAFAEASPPTLEKMKKGGKAKFIMYEAPGLGIDMDISLKGFTASLKDLHSR